MNKRTIAQTPMRRLRARVSSDGSSHIVGVALGGLAAGGALIATCAGLIAGIGFGLPGGGRDGALLALGSAAASPQPHRATLSAPHLDLERAARRRQQQPTTEAGRGAGRGTTSPTAGTPRAGADNPTPPLVPEPSRPSPSGHGAATATTPVAGAREQEGASSGNANPSLPISLPTAPVVGIPVPSAPAPALPAVPALPAAPLPPVQLPDPGAVTRAVPAP